MTLGGVELMPDIADQAEGPWGGLLTQAKLTVESFRDKISDDLAIPKWALVTQFDPPVQNDVALVIPAGRELNPKLALRIVEPGA